MSAGSYNKENFIELLDFVASDNDEIKRVLIVNSPQYLKLILKDVHRQIVNATSQRFHKLLFRRFGYSKQFRILYMTPGLT